MWGQDKWCQDNQVLKTVTQICTFLEATKRKMSTFWSGVWSKFWSNKTTETTAGTETIKGRARFARARPFVVAENAVVSVAFVASVASAVYDQVSQLVPVQQVDDIDEVHQLDSVHQVDHKDECSKIKSLQRRHHKMDQAGFKKRHFPAFLKRPRDILRA